MNSPILSIVVPCYNEEEVFPETVKRLNEVRSGLIRDGLISTDSYLLFVDDGSRDQTWELIEQQHRNEPHVCGLKLGRNAGHQRALLAGLMHAKEDADCVVSIDADLQDDVNAIRDMVFKFHEGYEIVYGIRSSRTTDTWFKRTTAGGFYKMMLRMGVKVHAHHADYRLMSRRALEELERFQEVNLFLRGIVPLLGFRQAQVMYDRHERFAGESKYPLRKMLSFALDGITSFSVTPIRLVTLTGFIFSVLSLAAAVYAISSKLLGFTVAGWSSLIVSVWFIGGVQLVALGLIGEYIGKIYKEVKHRPLYQIEKYLAPSLNQSGKNLLSESYRR
jgi:polyisoprenyl-phosphate glycosyltransferase